MRIACGLLVAALVLSPVASAQDFTAGPSTDPWLGYMNTTDLGGGDGWGSPWGIPDLVALFDDGAGTVELQPNQINDPDPYWYQGGGGPGAPGNRIMEANLYVELTDDALAGQTLTFSGAVLSNTFTAAHETLIFIKDFAPDYSSFTITTAPATPGAFNIVHNAEPGSGRHIQYGFQTTGVNVWSTDIGPFGNVVIATPEPSALLLLVLGGLALRRR